MKLRSFEQVLWSRRWVVLGVLCIAVVLGRFFISAAMPTYTASAAITYVGNGSDAVVQPPDLPELAMSSSVMQRAVTDGHLNIDPAVLPAQTTVRESPHSDIIPVTYRSKNYGFAIAAANAIADATIAEYKLLATRQYDEVIRTLQRQLSDVRGQIGALDARYQAYVHRDAMATAASGLDTLANRLEAIDEARAQAHAKLAQDLASQASTEASLSNAEFGSVIKEEAVARDPAFVALSAEQGKDLAAYETAKAGYTDAFPGLAELKSKVALATAATNREAESAARLHPGASPAYLTVLEMRQAARSLVAGDRAQVAALDHQYADTKNRLNELPTASVPADTVKVQRDALTAAYTQIESRLRTSMADKAAAGSLNSVVILDHASGASESMSPLTAVSIIVLLVFSLAIGAAYLAEMLDPRIRNRADVESLYGSPLIGSV